MSNKTIHMAIAFCGAFAVILACMLAYQNLQQSDEMPAVKILFIGNSYTFREDIPGVLQKIARSKGRNAKVGMAVKNGATFQDHVRSKQTLASITRDKWDYIVLQEQSQRMSFSNQQRDQESIVPGVQIAQFIRTQAPQARLLLYNTWGRKKGDQKNCPSMRELCTYEGMQARVNDGYRNLSMRTQAYIVPVGKVWQYVRGVAPQIELYDRDENHQSAAGAYLAAATFYRVIFQDYVTGAKAIGVDNVSAKSIQTAVDTMVQ